jgi:hypothetical protein
VAETIVPARPRHAPGTRLPEIHHELAQQPPGALLELPAGEEADTQAQWWSIFHRRPTVNGVAAITPLRYGALVHVIRKDWRGAPAHSLEGSRALDMLRTHFPIRYVLVQASAPEQMRLNLATTPSAFTLLAESGGARLYRFRNGETAVVIKRRFRADQLAGGLRARFSGPQGALLRVELNGQGLDELRLSGQRQERAWTIPPDRVSRGDNYLLLGLDGGELQLEEIAWREPGER